MATSKLTAPRRGVNPNLLVNWLFAGGGSQQGGGQFPINHNAQTSYPTGTTYCIDRWRHFYSDGGQTATQLQSDGILITATGGAGYIEQRGVEWESCKGQTITYSILYKDGSTVKLATKSGTMPSAPQESTVDVTGSLNSQVSHGAGCSLYVNSSGECIARVGVGSGYSLKVIAMKLELGDMQTLAHMENGVWVLSAVPSFQDEQLRCLTGQATGSVGETKFNVAVGKVAGTGYPYFRFYTDAGEEYQISVSGADSNPPNPKLAISKYDGSSWTTLLKFVPES